MRVSARSMVRSSTLPRSSSWASRRARFCPCASSSVSGCVFVSSPRRSSSARATCSNRARRCARSFSRILSIGFMSPPGPRRAVASVGDKHGTCHAQTSSRARGTCAAVWLKPPGDAPGTAEDQRLLSEGDERHSEDGEDEEDEREPILLVRHGDRNLRRPTPGRQGLSAICRNLFDAEYPAGTPVGTAGGLRDAPRHEGEEGSLRRAISDRRLFSRVFGILVGLGLGLPHNYQLQVRGRRSGRLYSTPVDVLVHRGKRFL